MSALLDRPTLLGVEAGVKWFSVGVDGEEYRDMSEMAARLGIDPAYYVANAIRVYTHLQRSILDEGEQVYLGKDGVAKKVLSIPPQGEDE